MSKRAEEAADNIGYIGISYKAVEIFKEGVKAGYEQAEKDLALTGEDMRLAFKAVNDALDNCDGKTREEVLEDALQRFNEQREKK